MPPAISIVVPTYRRGELLLRMLPSYVETEASEVIVLDDGSGPEDGEALERAAALPKVRVLRRAHRGLPEARNAGVDASTGEWVVFGEDDVWFTPEYPSVLVEHATRAGVRVASGCAPLVDPALLDGPVEELEATIRAKPMLDRPPDEFLGVPWPVRRLENGDVLTPLLTAGAAVRRDVFATVRFDPGFRGNAFREESDFFLSCLERGLSSIRCPHATCGHMKAHARAAGGGAWSMSSPRYALDMAANNWRLLRKHRDAILGARRAAGRRGGILSVQAAFLRSMLDRRRPAAA